MSKNDFGAAHWASDKVWDRRKGEAKNLRTLNKIQGEILLEFLRDHRVNIRNAARIESAG